MDQIPNACVARTSCSVLLGHSLLGTLTLRSAFQSGFLFDVTVGATSANPVASLSWST